MIKNFHKFKYISIFLAPITLLLLFAYQTIVTAGTAHLTSDLAANMLLVNKIYQHGYLLFGNYSRFNFNHLGPFSYYFFFIFENIFKFFDCTRWQSWIFAIILRNAFLISVASILFSKYLKNSIRLFDVFIFQLLFIGLLNEDLISIWPPHIFITTFIVFVLAVSLYFRDNEFLWLTVLSALILIGDYVTQGPIILPVIFIVLIYNLAYKNHPLFKKNYRKNILGISAFIVLFLLPIFFDIMINYPNNIQKILQVNQSFAFAAQPSYWMTIKIFGDLYLSKVYLSYSACFLALFSLLLILLERRIHLVFSSLYYIFLISFMLLCMGVFISKHTAAPLYSYTISCFEVLYPLVLSLLCCSSCSNIMQASWEKAKKLLFLIFSLCILIQPLYYAMVNKITMNDDIAILSNYFLKHDSKPVVFAQPDFSDWSEMIGILLYLSDHNINVYATRTNLDYVYTPERVMSAAEPHYLLLKKKLCAYMLCQIVSQSEKMAIIKAPVLLQRSSKKITENLSGIQMTTVVNEIIFNRTNKTDESDMQIIITNSSKLNLLSPLFYNNGIYLSYHLFDAQMNLIANRLSLPLIANIPEGATQKEWVTLYKPHAPGIYYAKLAMTQEGGNWLLDDKVQTPIIKLIVK